MMTNLEMLQMLMGDLRSNLGAVNSNPIMPGSVKSAVNTTFQILEILIEEAKNRG